MTARKIQYLPLASIEPATRNPKGHNAELVKASVSRFGFVEPVVLDERTGRLVAGHGRRDELLARKAAGDPAPDGVRVAKGEWLIPVVCGWSSADDAEAEAAGIALNQSTIAGGWDDAALAGMLAELAESERGLDGLGFDRAALDELIRHVGFDARVALNGEGGESGGGSAVGPVADPITRSGDLWRCGEHRVVCGDSFDSEARALLLDGVEPSAAVMDPPFAIYGSASGISSSVADDKMVRPFFEQLGRTIHELLPDFGHAYVCCDWRSYATLWDGFRSAGMTPKNCLVWDKGHFGMGSNWANAHEFVAYFSRMPPERTMSSGRKAGARTVNRGNMLRYPRVTGDDREHNAAKPVAMLVEIIEAATDPDAWVVDLFGGSGAVLAAAEECGRLSATMEYEPGWVDVILRRFQRLTGILPSRDGQPHDFLATE